MIEQRRGEFSRREDDLNSRLIFLCIVLQKIRTNAKLFLWEYILKKLSLRIFKHRNFNP